MEYDGLSGYIFGQTYPSSSHLIHKSQPGFSPIGTQAKQPSGGANIGVEMNHSMPYLSTTSAAQGLHGNGLGGSLILPPSAANASVAAFGL
jgi:hypothetical protein